VRCGGEVVHGERAMGILIDVVLLRGSFLLAYPRALPNRLRGHFGYTKLSMTGSGALLAGRARMSGSTADPAMI
jgi:hypothetical protein